MRDWQIEAKVGAFVLIMFVLLAIVTLKISEGASLFSSGYRIHVTLNTATGVDEKTPVEVAGINVGLVETIELSEDSRSAIATLLITRSGVVLPQSTRARVQAKGFLGDTYIELVPGAMGDIVADGGSIGFDGSGGDMNTMITRFSEIAESVQEMVDSQNGPVPRAVDNIDAFTKIMRELIESNQRNVNTMLQNFASLSQDLRQVIAADGRSSMHHLSSITRKIDQGYGTVGQLVNNEETVEKVNDALDSLNKTLGGFNSYETEIGYHTEFLGSTKDFKHYIHFNLWPRPDQAFMFEFVEDRSPSANRVTRTTAVTAGGATNTVVSNISTIDRNRFLVSAQIAKRFYDFTLRGGIIESRGGFGVDYKRGPLSLSMSAFDFNTQASAKPHLKAWGKFEATPALYLMGGVDDPLNPNQGTDYFMGAGVQLKDDDIKSLLSAGGMSAAFSN